MKQNKKVGIILLVLFAAAVLGGMANGSFENLADENIAFCIGYVGGLAALLVIGLLKLFGKKE